MEELLMHRGDCSFCTKLIRSSVFATRKKEQEETDGVTEFFPVGVLNEDFHLLVQLLRTVGPVASLPGHAYHVFYRVGSNSRKAEAENFSRVYGDNVDNADMVAEIVEESYPELKKTAFRFGIFQRLDYLLHIPIGQMTKDNTMYCNIVSYLRKNWLKSMTNPILTLKNKVYHTLFAISTR